MYVDVLKIFLSCSQLTFDKGDLITVTKVVDGGWWEGICNGNVGWFPGNYVEDILSGKFYTFYGLVHNGVPTLCILAILQVHIHVHYSMPVKSSVLCRPF